MAAVAGPTQEATTQLVKVPTDLPKCVVQLTPLVAPLVTSQKLQDGE